MVIFYTAFRQEEKFHNAFCQLRRTFVGLRSGINGFNMLFFSFDNYLKPQAPGCRDIWKSEIKKETIRYHF